jgi:hypothetical protein
MSNLEIKDRLLLVVDNNQALALLLQDLTESVPTDIIMAALIEALAESSCLTKKEQQSYANRNRLVVHWRDRPWLKV